MNGDDKLGDVSVRMSELAEKEKLIDKKNNGGKSGVQAKNDVQKQSLASQMKKKVAIDYIKLKIDIKGGKRLHHCRRNHWARKVNVHQPLHWPSTNERLTASQSCCNILTDMLFAMLHGCI